MNIFLNLFSIVHFAFSENRWAARTAQVFCYLTSWSAKRPGVGKFEPKNIDASLCTHIVYAFATLKDHILTEANDDDPENYDKLIELREKNPDIQVGRVAAHGSLLTVQL